VEPWSYELAGRFDEHQFESEVLKDNPLGDPHVRPLWVYTPPGYDGGPAIYVLQGYTGQVEMWRNRAAFRPTIFELLDREQIDARIVFVDAWTSVGGSQFVDSRGSGNYHSYICDEIVPFVDERYPTAASRDHRGLTGKSSGGYGAMVVPMLRPDVFGALASHAGDALFEAAYLPEMPGWVRTMREHFEGSMEVFFEQIAAFDHFDLERFRAIEFYGYAAAYSPDPQRPGKALLPVDLATGRLIDDVWAQWLEKDPVRMAPAHADALRSMRRIYLDAGMSDEYYLDLGATAFGAELDKLGVEHTVELFDGKHGGIAWRYPGAIRELVLALT
jgi:S-formylglutathione hydrolase FrmB